MPISVQVIVPQALRAGLQWELDLLWQSLLGKKLHAWGMCQPAREHVYLWGFRRVNVDFPHLCSFVMYSHACILAWSDYQLVQNTNEFLVSICSIFPSDRIILGGKLTGIAVEHEALIYLEHFGVQEAPKQLRRIQDILQVNAMRVPVFFCKDVTRGRCPLPFFSTLSSIWWPQKPAACFLM